MYMFTEWIFINSYVSIFCIGNTDKNSINSVPNPMS